MGRSSASNESGGGGSSGLQQRPSSSSLLGSGSTNNAAASPHEGPSPPPPALPPVAAGGAGKGGVASASSSSSSPRKQRGESSNGTTGTSTSGGGGDRWTGLLAALWALLFLALCVNRQELWVVLAGLVGYACLCLLLDVVAIPPFWEDNNGPLKASQAARLSNGLVCVAHSIAMGLAAGALMFFVCGFWVGYLGWKGVVLARLRRRPGGRVRCWWMDLLCVVWVSGVPIYASRSFALASFLPIPPINSFNKHTHTHTHSPGRLPPPQAHHGLRLPPLRPVGQSLEAPLHEPALPLHARGALRHAGGCVVFSMLWWMYKNTLFLQCCRELFYAHNKSPKKG